MATLFCPHSGRHKQSRASHASTPVFSVHICVKGVCSSGHSLQNHSLSDLPLPAHSDRSSILCFVLFWSLLHTALEGWDTYPGVGIEEREWIKTDWWRGLRFHAGSAEWSEETCLGSSLYSDLKGVWLTVWRLRRGERCYSCALLRDLLCSPNRFILLTKTFAQQTRG